MALIVFLAIAVPGLATPLPGSTIDNTAQAQFSQKPGGSPKPVVSNTHSDVVVPLPTPAEATFMRYQPGSPETEPFLVGTTQYSTSGTLDGPFIDLPLPVAHPGSNSINLEESVELLDTEMYLSGDPLFIKLTDLDENLFYYEIDTVMVTITSSTGDSEVLILKESEQNSGIFVGYIQSSRISGTQVDGVLFVEQNGTIKLSYVDDNDDTDLAAANALFDPMGVVFDSETGERVDGTTITIIDTATGQPAEVFGDDGVSRYPSTVVSGGTVTDSSGRVYDFPTGFYRFPLMYSGTYRLEITPAQGHAAPSEVPDNELQQLPGAPWDLHEDGSRGRPFTLPPLPIFKLDIPVDPVVNSIWTEKSSMKDTAAIGDFIPYQVTVSNSSPRGRVDDVHLYDRLPKGFRYQKGSARIDERDVEPEISTDGRTLTFPLGNMNPDEIREIDYVTEVAAGTAVGKASNSAVAIAKDDLQSNIAKVTVKIKDDFMRHTVFLAGQVVTGGCDENADNLQGVSGIRIYLEDGTYVVTDENGRYHIEGVEPGTHVVQIDPKSYQDRYEAVICTPDSRFANRGWSQFVDLQPGSLWRVNFHLEQKATNAESLPSVTNSELTEGHSTKKTGSLGVNMFSEQGADGRVQVNLPLKVTAAPARNARISLILPPDLEYIPGSSQVNQVAVDDPAIMTTVLNYSLGDLPADSNQTLQLSLQSRPTDENAAATIMAMLTIDAAEQQNLRSGMLTTTIGESGDGETSEGQVLTYHPLQQTESSGRVTSEPGLTKPTTLKELRSRIFSDAYPAEMSQGAEWLWPTATFYPAIPSIKVAVKHDPQHRVRFTLNDEAVSPLNFDGTRRNDEKTATLSQWNGVDLLDGDNLLRIEIIDQNGTTVFDEERIIHHSMPPVEAKVVAEESTLIADSSQPAVIAVKLLDSEGHPAREGIVGEFKVRAPYRADDQHHSGSGTNQDNEKSRFKVGENGITRLAISPTSQAGEVELILRLAGGEKTVKAWLAPEQRDWILVGFAEGTLGYNTFSGNEVSLKEAGIDEHYYDDGQVKFFAKGAIRGEWLLTMAYDSDKPDLDGDSLRQEIDPDTYYPLYGDGTRQGYEAASASDIYLKLEREQFYAMFGDMDSGLNQTELSRYARSMNGIKSEMQGDTFSYTLFAADTKQAFAKDEIRGDGTSGRYYLSTNDLVTNSEEVVIEVRDRFRSERTLETRTLSRHSDYDIDYEAGSLFFKEPVPSKDENFNPVFIVIRYETEDSTDENFNYGGRASVKLFDQKIEVGVSHIHEERGAGQGELFGADATVKLTEKTTLNVEAATTDSEFYNEKKNADAYLAEVEHDGDQLKSMAYYREQQAGFGLGQQNGSETGTRKYGVEGSYNVTKSLQAAGLAYHEDNLSTDAEREVIEVDGRYNAESYSLRTGLREARDSFNDGEVQRSTQWLAGADLFTLNRKLRLSADYEQSLSGKDDNSDFPTLLTLGADYRITEKVSIFSEQEFSWGEKEKTEGTRAGIKLNPWGGADVNTTLERQFNENGERVNAIFGLTQNWQVTERWGFDFSVDRSHTIKEPGNDRFNTDVPAAHGSNDDFTSLSVGATYRKEKWAWWNKLETRQADNEDKYGISTSVVVEPQDGVAISAKALAFITRSTNGSRKTDGNIRLGMAYRPTASRWIVLNRLDFYFENEDHSSNEYDNWRIVNNLHTNFRLSRKAQMSFYYGLKYVRDTYNGITYSGFTDLIAIEARYNINKRWDIGVHASILHSWNSNNFDYSAGADVGYSPITNTWISLGYNLVGFKDEDFSAANYTAEGAYLRFRAKFDQQSVKEAAGWINR